MGSIAFFKEEVHFRIDRRESLVKWIASAFRAHRLPVGQINYIFCNDRYLLKLNKKYLQHAYFTDVITFDYSEDEKKVADIFISVDRVKANALKYKTKFRDELHRVMIHGALHLMGYGDKSESKRREMRLQEDVWLAKRTF